MESQSNTPLELYSLIWAETLERIKLRDGILTAYVAGASTILGGGLSSPDSINILFIIPYLSFGAAVIVSQHHLMIGQLSVYCAEHLGPIIIDNSGVNSLIEWHKSEPFTNFVKRASNYRTYGHLILIEFPALTSLVLSFKAVYMGWFSPASCLLLLLWLGGAFLLISGTVILCNSRWQKNKIDFPPSQRH